MLLNTAVRADLREVSTTPSVRASTSGRSILTNRPALGDSTGEAANYSGILVGIMR